MTGKEAAERILRGAGIYDVRVEHVGGNLTDHYDPRSKVLRLSDATGAPLCRLRILGQPLRGL